MAKAAIIGLGRSGIAAARCLKRDGWQVTLSDRSDSPSLQATKTNLEREGIIVNLGQNLSLEASDLPDLIVVSPGVPWDAPILITAREKGIDTIGPPGWGLRELTAKPPPPPSVPLFFKKRG